MNAVMGAVALTPRLLSSPGVVPRSVLVVQSLFRVCVVMPRVTRRVRRDW